MSSLLEHLSLALALLAHRRPSQALQVYPSGPALSASTLRLSIDFASPQKDVVLSRLRLQNQNAEMLTNVFLNQELWSPDRKELTIFFDPGRLKAGLARREELGTPLAHQISVTLLLDGKPIKRWQVQAGECTPIAVHAWHIHPPKSRSVTPLVINFPEPIDHLAMHLIAVLDSSGRRMKGTEALTHFEQEWSLIPDRPWQTGVYRVVVHPEFENSCGDEIGDPFEHSTEASPAAVRARSFVALP